MAISPSPLPSSPPFLPPRLFSFLSTFLPPFLSKRHTENLSTLYTQTNLLNSEFWQAIVHPFCLSQPTFIKDFPRFTFFSFYLAILHTHMYLFLATVHTGNEWQKLSRAMGNVSEHAAVSGCSWQLQSAQRISHMLALGPTRLPAVLRDQGGTLCSVQRRVSELSCSRAAGLPADTAASSFLSFCYFCSPVLVGQHEQLSPAPQRADFQQVPEGRFSVSSASVTLQRHSCHPVRYSCVPSNKVLIAAVGWDGFFFGCSVLS